MKKLLHWVLFTFSFMIVKGLVAAPPAKLAPHEAGKGGVKVSTATAPGVNLSTGAVMNSTGPAKDFRQTPTHRISPSAPPINTGGVPLPDTTAPRSPSNVTAPGPATLSTDQLPKAGTKDSR